MTMGPKTATIMVTALDTATSGSYYSLDVNATTATTLFHGTTISVHIPPPELGTSAQNSYLTIQTSSSATDTIHLQALNGLTDSMVTISATVLAPPPSATPPTASFSPASVTLSAGVGTSTLTVLSTSSTIPGDYNVRVTGTTSSNVTNSTDVHVAVMGSSFDIIAKPSSFATPPSSTTVSTINVTSLEGFSGEVTLSAIVIPPSTSISPALAHTLVALVAGSYSTSDLTIAVSGSATPGSYTILVTGKGSFITKSGPIELTVLGAPGFSFAASPNELTVSQGGSPKTSTIDLASLNGFSDTVDLSIYCSPDGLNASLTIASVSVTPSAGGTAMLSVAAYSFAPPSSYSITVHGASTTSTAANSTTISVIVTGPSFSLSAFPFIASLAPGGLATSTITARSILGLTGAIDLAAVVNSSPNPSAGLTATLSPTTLTFASGGSGTSTLTLTAAALGNYTVTITGTSWPLTKEIGIVVDVTNAAPGFEITASPPPSTPADGTTTATSNIAVNPFPSFADTVTLSDAPLPVGLNCQAFTSKAVTGSSQSSLSCTSSTAGSYPVIITGTSGSLIHLAMVIFTFTSTASHDFTISAAPPVNFVSGSTTTSSVTVTARNGFHSQVALTASVSPSTGLSVSLNPTTLVYGSGSSTATFSSTTPGSYAVTITGTHGSMISTVTVQVTVTPQETSTPDITISTNISSLSFNTGSSGTATITVAAQNGFTGAITLAVNAPTGVSCSLSSTNIQSSGASTLTCSSNLTGDYTVRITTNGAPNEHTTTVNVHVSAVSSSAPFPSSILRLAPGVLYGIIGVIVVAVVAGTVLVLRTRRSES